MTTITLPRATVEQVLEALESVDWYLSQLEEIVYSSGDIGQHEERAKAQPAMQALRAALTQHSPATLFDPRGSLGEPIV